MEATKRTVQLWVIVGSFDKVVTRSVRLDGGLEFVIYRGYRYYLRTLPTLSRPGFALAYYLYTVDSPFQPHPVTQPFPLHK
jgi:hypothetical protein